MRRRKKELFKPTRLDGRSFRDVAVEYLKDRPFEEVVTYDDLGTALGLSPKADRHLIQGAVRAANRVMLETKSIRRGLVNEKNIGYRIAHPREHTVVATGLASRAERQLSNSLLYYRGADLQHMTESERQLHTGQQMLAEATYGAFQHLDARLKRIESIIDAKVVNENPL